MDESIAREYFELNGFVTVHLRKGRAQSKRSMSEEGLDLYIRNTRIAETDRPPSFLLFSSELRRLESLSLIHI